MGEAYRIGIGVPQDLLEAKKWYEMAAEQGYADAVERLRDKKFKKINTE